MKAKIKATGEIVNIAEYATIALEMRDSYGEPICLKPEDIELIQEQTVDEHCQDPHCGSKLELEKGDIWWHKDIDGGKSPCVTCAACGKGFDVEGWKGIYKLY